MSEKLNPGGLPTTRKKYTTAFEAEWLPGPGKRTWPAPKAFRRHRWRVGNAVRWNRPRLVARSATKSNGYGPNPSARKWSALH